MRKDSPGDHFRSSAGREAARAAYRACLACIAHPIQERVIPTSCGDTHVVAAGPELGRPVVLLHGWNTHAGGWWPQINQLAARYRILAPDTIGHAGLSAPTRLSMRGPGYAEWLREVLEGLGAARADLVGSSGGAWLILKLAERFPERIRSAVLISPAGISPIRPGFLLRGLASGWLFPGPDTPRRMARLFTPAPIPLDEAHIAADAPLILGFKSQAPPPVLPSRSLNRLSAPTLILVGEYERVFSPDRLLARARKQVPGLIEAERVRGAGHDLTYDQPVPISGRIERFLERS